MEQCGRKATTATPPARSAGSKAEIAPCATGAVSRSRTPKAGSAAAPIRMEVRSTKGGMRSRRCRLCSIRTANPRGCYETMISVMPRRLNRPTFWSHRLIALYPQQLIRPDRSKDSRRPGSRNSIHNNCLSTAYASLKGQSTPGMAPCKRLPSEKYGRWLIRLSTS